MSLSPKVSIIMPLFNSGNYVTQSIESVFLQDYSNWELIIVDDCSTDDSLRNVQKYLADKRVMLIRNQENKGAAYSRNLAISLSTGDYIAFLDADDIWLPQKLSNQLGFMIKNKYSFSYTLYGLIDSKGTSKKKIIMSPNKITKKGLLKGCSIGCLTVMVSSKLAKSNYIDSKIKKRNDFALWLKYLNFVDGHLFPEVTAKYRAHEKSLSSSKKFKLIPYHYYVFRHSENLNIIKSLWYTALNIIFYIRKKLSMYRNEIDFNNKALLINQYDYLLIDPWGINNVAQYTQGLYESLSSKTRVLLISNYHSDIPNSYKIFFRRSEANRTIFRKLFRVMEYFIAYRKIFSIIKKKRIKAVHIQWLLAPKLDYYLLKELKKKNVKIIYTAHNVVPHRKYYDNNTIYSKIYNLCDSIITHGSSLKTELSSRFNVENHKVAVIKHGVYVDNRQNERKKLNILTNNKDTKIFLMVGYMFYQKGADRLISIWKNHFSDCNAILIILGKVDNDYTEFSNQLKASLPSSITVIDQYVEESLMQSYMEACDVVVLPYRNASMSGVIFTAALFQKVVLSTRVGAIPEYLKDDCSFICENNEKDLMNSMDNIINEYTKIQLHSMGKKLHDYIYNTCSWDIISELTLDLYKKLDTKL